MAAQPDLEELARGVIDCGFSLHRDLGPGLLESVYGILMLESLRRRGFDVEREVPIRIEYNGILIDNAFKADLLVEGQLLVELKSTERYSPVHAKQVITYLRLMHLPLGLLMNFGFSTFKEGIHRLVNDYRPV